MSYTSFIKNQTFKHHKYTQTFNFCQTKNSFPRFPDFRYVAYGSLSTVADDGRLQDLLIIQDFSIFFISDGILNQGQRVFIFAFRVEHGVEAADGLFDLGIFAFTQALFFQVDDWTLMFRSLK